MGDIDGEWHNVTLGRSMAFFLAIVGNNEKLHMLRSPWLSMKNGWTKANRKNRWAAVVVV